MTEISRRLRAAREQAGLSIEDIAATTKIRPAALQAIERGEFERLPGDFYTRAFLRTYARELHLPPDEIVQDYDAARGVAQPQPEIAAPARPGRAAAADRQATSPGGRVRDHLAIPATWSIPAWLTSEGARSAAALIVVVAVLLVMTVFRHRPAGNRPAEAGAVATTGVVEASAVKTDAARRPEAAPDKLVLEIQPAGPVWVTGAADGNRVLYRLLAPGERVTVEARDELSFRIGNAVAFMYKINGRQGKPLGGPDEVREFQITRENYRTFGR